jgi:hypothetical protein
VATKVLSILILLLAVTACFGRDDSNDITAEDKAFFQKLQKAVLNDDFEWFSGAVAYPVNLHYDKRRIQVKSAEQLKKHKARIFSAHNKEVIKAQKTDALFKNWQGVMIGRGEFWFDQVEEKPAKDGAGVWVYRILTINELPGAPR